MPRLDLNIGKKNDEVETPDYLLDWLKKRYGDFDFDPCPFPQPPWNGLEKEWGKNNFVNPPFSNIRKWLEKGVKEMEKGKKTVFLLTARTSSKYWFDLVWPNAAEVIFLEGGVIFKGYENRFPIPIAIVQFDPEKKKGGDKKRETYSEKLRFTRVFYSS